MELAGHHRLNSPGAQSRSFSSSHAPARGRAGTAHVAHVASDGRGRAAKTLATRKKKRASNAAAAAATRPALFFEFQQSRGHHLPGRMSCRA